MSKFDSRHICSRAGDHRMKATELAILGEALRFGRGSGDPHPVRRLTGLVGSSEREQLRCRVAGSGWTAITATRRIAGFRPAASTWAASKSANSSGVGWSSSGIIK